MPPATFRVMTIHEEGRTGNDTCGGSSTLQSLSGFSDDFESKFDVALHQDTKGFILEPGRKARVRIRFAPETVYNNFKQCKYGKYSAINSYNYLKLFFGGLPSFKNAN